MKFIKQLFSESDGASFSRMGSFMALVCACVWVTVIVWQPRALAALDGLTPFICSLYGLGKAGQTLQRMGGRRAAQQVSGVGFQVSGDSRLSGNDQSASEVRP